MVLAGIVLQKLESSGDQIMPVAQLKALMAGYREQGGSMDRRSVPQNPCCLEGWSIRSTPECLEGERGD